MVNRLIEPTSGTITIDGKDAYSLPAPELRRSIGYVIQQTGLFPHMRVQDNIAVVPRLLKWERRRVASRVTELLDLVGLPPERYARRYPSQLSGGEQQRVGLARALAAEPSTMLMDEPFGALDAITRTRLQGELKRIHRQLGHTILFVTHDVDEAFALANRIVVMSHGEIVQVGTPLEIITNPATEFVANLVDANDAMRRMSLMPIAAAVLPLNGARPTSDAESRLGPDSTLRDALSALVVADTDRLPVHDLDNVIVGEVSLESVREATSGHVAPASARVKLAD
jgi:osmoprotectant transport system ATP-binding protein